MKLTRPQFLALINVRAGRCFRRFTATGNFVPKDGGNGLVLWRLEYMGLIREGRTNGSTKAVFELSDAGRAALREAEDRRA